MIALTTNTRSPKKAGRRPALEIRFHFVDGPKQTFTEANPETVGGIPSDCADLADLTEAEFNWSRFSS
jgi:hypothetical protein